MALNFFPTDCKFSPQVCELLITRQLPDLEHSQHIYDIACFKCPLSIRIFQTQEAICNKAIQLGQWNDGLWVRRLHIRISCQQLNFCLPLSSCHFYWGTIPNSLALFLLSICLYVRVDGEETCMLSRVEGCGRTEPTSTVLNWNYINRTELDLHQPYWTEPTSTVFIHFLIRVHYRNLV
jgi:hypothetical protein